VVAGTKWNFVRDFVGDRAVLVKAGKAVGQGHAVNQARLKAFDFSGPVFGFLLRYAFDLGEDRKTSIEELCGEIGRFTLLR